MKVTSHRLYQLKIKVNNKDTHRENYQLILQQQDMKKQDPDLEKGDHDLSEVRLF